MSASLNPAPTLYNKWQNLLVDEPRLRIRNAANTLDVSELELLLCQPEGTVLLRDYQAILDELPKLGRVMSLARNENCVHEVTGAYPALIREAGGMIGLVHGGEQDIRWFFYCWKFAVAVRSGEGKNERFSLQFFDKSGTAVQKVFLTEDSNRAAYDTIVETFGTETRTVELEAIPHRPGNPAPADPELFKTEWSALQDTHDFFGLLRKHKVSRRGALKHAPEGMVHPLPLTAVPALIKGLAASAVRCMFFVGNRGSIQIFSGEIKKTLRTGPWFNVLDPGFNLHLRDSAIDSAWLVRKPTVDGIVTSVECFDKDGEMVVQVFGDRKPGKEELPRWRALAESLVA
jgi:putative hemin transport protein